MEHKSIVLQTLAMITTIMIRRIPKTIRIKLKAEDPVGVAWLFVTRDSTAELQLKPQHSTLAGWPLKGGFSVSFCSARGTYSAVLTLR